MNPFDIVVCVVAIAAMIIGFNVGLIRTMATILGYISAAPVAVAGTPLLSRVASGQSVPNAAQSAIIFCFIFLAAGIAFGALMRYSVDGTVGPRRSLPDRLAGSIFGIVRIALVAVTIVVVFDRIIPPGHDPAYLAGSKLRPLLSQAGQRGLSSLPPDMAAYIDRIKIGLRS